MPSASAVAPINLANQLTSPAIQLVNASEENKPATFLPIFSNVAARFSFLTLYSLINDVPSLKEPFDSLINSWNLSKLLPIAPTTLLAPSAFTPKKSKVFATSVAFIPFKPLENSNMKFNGLVLIMSSTDFLEMPIT